MVAPEAMLSAARQALASGDALAAVDLLHGIAPDAQNRESHQLLAAALLRAGALSDARAQIAALLAAGHRDEETLGLAAREAKARWQQGDAGSLLAARDAYLLAFRETGGTWTGINAATLTLIAGDKAAAQRLAREVQSAIATMPSPAGFWELTTAGEAALILGEIGRAAAYYRDALSMAPRAFGDHRSARDHAYGIVDALSEPRSALAAVFPAIGVAAFSGHTVDHAKRVAPRFPSADEGRVAEAIAAAIRTSHIEIGISAAACGADIMFLEAMQAAGKETYIVLPHPAEIFRKISVTEIGGASWGQRFDRVLAGATELTVLAPHPGENLAYQFHGAVMAGSAILRAEAVGGHALGLAYWDGELGGVGGTSTVIEEWAQRGLETVLLPCGNEPGGMMSESRARSELQGVDLRCANGQRVVSILFADAVGFSRLSELQVKAFVREFWGRVGKLLEGLPAHALRIANTWGDGLFLVFDGALDAAGTALDIARLVATTRWSELGLPAETDIRVALHAGPVYEIMDPVTRRPGFAGMHISRAARIEPVTPPREVYVSEAFAALLAFDDNQDRFHCEYVGTVPMAKDYGRFRTYRLTRR
jgi:class 3 adenylate cyclase